MPNKESSFQQPENFYILFKELEKSTPMIVKICKKITSLKFISAALSEPQDINHFKQQMN